MISRLKEGDTEGNQQNPRNVINSKLCQTLNISIIEDEFHFLMICPAYESKRKIMLDTIYSSFPNVKVLDAIIIIYKTNDPILNLTPENITQHSRIE